MKFSYSPLSSHFFPMPFLLGTDEAGYGPNLGPLVISASLWEVPEGVRGDELYERLQTVIAPAAARSAKAAGQRVAIADSKAALSIGQGTETARTRTLGRLEPDRSAAGRLRRRLESADRPRLPDRAARPFATAAILLPRPARPRCGGNRSASSHVVRRPWPRPACGSSICKASPSFPASSTTRLTAAIRRVRPFRIGPCNSSPA